ncbi:Ubiquitin carboxyl-terminal hydrolase 2 [Charadrius vociferus]|uniref:Ubiquitin carboxyl-terminal hydrolase 2 n=1 Tax=Charadrius vociferus TaxID=50402 RepID=A0A0A0ACG5_CHAVO|nr:Ubiquitin carboxyl-terminal hydrolase 2 [Charadrius vociferus]
MSQLSSTLKRYVDSSRYAETTYSKVPSGYSSYTSYGSTLTTSYADSDKIGFKSSYLPSPRYHHTGLSPTSGYDSSRLPLYSDSSIRLSPTYIRTQPRSLHGGLSGSAYYTFTGAPSSPPSYLSTTAPLSRRKSISHSDLAREFSGLHTSDSAYTPTPGPLSTRGRQELGALQGLYQAAAHSDYVRGYLDSYGRKSSHGSLPMGSLSPSHATLGSALPPSGTRCASHPCERNDSYCDVPARDPTVRGACWGRGTKLGCSGVCSPCPLVLSRGAHGTLRSLTGNLVSPWQQLLCTASHVVVGTRCPRYRSVLHHPQSLSLGREQASQTQPSSGVQESSLVIFHSGFLPRSGQALPASSPRNRQSPAPDSTPCGASLTPAPAAHPRCPVPPHVLGDPHPEVGASPQPCWGRCCAVGAQPVGSPEAMGLATGTREWGVPANPRPPAPHTLSLTRSVLSQKGYGEVTLMDCLRLFTKEDVLDGDEKPTCCRCKARTRCTKKFSIQKFPKILVLHLKRFSEARIRTSKLTTFVNFQLKDLDLREFASQSCNHAIYNLYAVSNHSGTTMGGHYTAYCKSPISSEWHSFNDSRVTPMSSSHVRSSDAYLLFYELASPSSRM